jgi:glyoxylase-like metal-dependent hydrolase (beta-lactamase superfamily II)
MTPSGTRAARKGAPTKRQASELTWDVYVTELESTASEDPPPGSDVWLWSPTSATLICGEQDAVLVDALLPAQAPDLADWIADHDRNLKYVYITHGHGDHWFGLSVILERFPEARAVALPAVIEQMRIGRSPEVLALWNALFPGKILEALVMAQPLPDHTIHLEGHELVGVELGHTDTDATTCLYVPDIGLVVAGDAVYNDVHQYLRESDAEARREWIAALYTIESLRPRHVIAGHQRAGRPDGPEIIAETRDYIRDFDRIVESAATAREVYDHMLDLYPERINPGMLWWSARTLKP